MGGRALGALAVGAGLLAVGAVFAVGAVRDGPGVSDTDELAEAIGDIQNYECESHTDVGDTIEFDGGTARQRFCTLTENGEEVFGGDGASVIELVVVTPPEAMDEFVAYNKRTTRSTVPAIVGENWFIPGLGGEEGEPVRRDFLGGLEGAREGEYGVFQRR